MLTIPESADPLSFNRDFDFTGSLVANLKWLGTVAFRLAGPFAKGIKKVRIALRWCTEPSGIEGSCTQRNRRGIPPIVKIRDDPHAHRTSSSQKNFQLVLPAASAKVSS